MVTRYPRTPHLPWSEGATPDDVRRATAASFDGRDVVVTEKLDGENTTLYRDHLHARSLDLSAHPSRTWMKAFHDRIRLRIPEGLRVCGEGLYAKHAIRYAALESWFYVFSVWDADDRCLDWDATVAFGKRIGAPTPRVLYRGPFDEKKLRKLTFDRATTEGYVVRTVEGFHREDFGDRIAKYVRKDHVVANEHWARAAVVPNGLSPSAILWDVRSGLRADAGKLAALLGVDVDPTHVADVEDRLDAVDRFGDARLEGVLAAALHRVRRSEILPAIAPVVGPRVARRVADLVGLAPKLRGPFPDDLRARGLRRVALAADVGVLHAVAGATAVDSVERDLVAWSDAHANDAGLLVPSPLAPLRRDARAALAHLPAARAQRCWSAMREKWIEGRVHTIHDGVAATHDLAREDHGHLVVLCGPSGSGKSTFTKAHLDGYAVLSLDDLRSAAGDRADQSENRAVLSRALADADALLARGRQVAWDATSLVPAQRGLVADVARRHEALTSIVVLSRSRAALDRTNEARGANRVPSDVLAQQLGRFTPPYPGEADRIVYVSAEGDVADTAGDLFTDELEP